MQKRNKLSHKKIPTFPKSSKKHTLIKSSHKKKSWLLFYDSDLITFVVSITITLRKQHHCMMLLHKKPTTTVAVPTKRNHHHHHQTRKKSVSFGKSVKVRLSIHIKEYTNEEIGRCWYSPEDFQTIRSDMQATATLIKQGALIHDTERYCRRGVECKTGKNKLRKQQLRAAGWFTVLYEQDVFEQHKRQHTRKRVSSSSDDSEYYIARAYRAASASALSIARATALKDQLEV